MRRTAPVAAAVLASLLACLPIHGASASDSQRVELMRILAEHPWLSLSQRWAPFSSSIEQDLTPEADLNVETGDERNEHDIMVNSEKRSAVATALNAGRRRRQPTPALGKAATPYFGVGVLNDVGSFFDSLRDNLETLASLSPQQRATLMQEPSVVRARQSGSTTRIGGGGGMRRMFPTRVTGKIRSYNRRSFVEAEGYPGANHHDPAFLWTGLGR